jgi:virginiamycin B lyase
MFFTRWYSRLQHAGCRRLPARSDRVLVRPWIESLEDRCLPSAGGINQFLTGGADFPNRITVGPDGNLWFTDAGSNSIGRINPTTHAIKKMTLPPNSAPQGITAGSDGNLWFTEAGSNKIGRLSTSFQLMEFSIPTPSSEPVSITKAPGLDSDLWFTEFSGDKIGRITTAGTITDFKVPTPASGPLEIAANPDGGLWFTEFNANKIGRIDPVTHAFTEITVAGAPQGITTGPGNLLFFTEEATNKIGQLVPSSHAVTTFSVPTASSGLAEITLGPDHNLWFTESTGNNIGRLDGVSHQVTEFAIPTAVSMPEGITAGPDGNIWFTEVNANQIGQLVLDKPLGQFVGLTVSAIEGQEITSSVLEFHDSDPVSNTSSYLTTIDWGDGTSSTGTITTIKGGGFAVTGTHAYAEDGRFVIHVTITDINQSHDIGGFTDVGLLAFAHVADAPLAVFATSFSTPRNTLFSGVVANFADGDPRGGTGDFTATINWGDHTANSKGQVKAANAGGFLVDGTHTYTSTGTFIVAVQITDAGGSSIGVAGSAEVTGPLATPGRGANALDAPTLAALDSLYADDPIFAAGAGMPGARHRVGTAR